MRLGLQGCAAGYAASVLSGCCPSTSTIAQTSQAIDTAVQGAMSQYTIPSVSYALMSCGQIVTAHAFGTAVNLPFFPGGGDLRPVQATPATVYQAASLSKTLAAVASLWIVQHGQL
ncbi:MAG: serine hydrolase, partial [Candidatus Acidiferrales bacterium]